MNILTINSHRIEFIFSKKNFKYKKTLKMRGLILVFIATIIQFGSFEAKVLNVASGMFFKTVFLKNKFIYFFFKDTLNNYTVVIVFDKAYNTMYSNLSSAESISYIDAFKTFVTTIYFFKFS